MNAKLTALTSSRVIGREQPLHEKNHFCISRLPLNELVDAEKKFFVAVDDDVPEYDEDVVEEDDPLIDAFEIGGSSAVETEETVEEAVFP
uniref:Uncharacterized protein n=1 Tax=Panagrolaimus superbus TaxID=310955 RepID=A0A914YJI0_9BILA